MSDQDPADPFERHRGAVLDALLSEPGLSSESAKAESGTGSSLPPGPTGQVAPGGPTPSAPNATARPAGGPKASDRIMALLNGESPDKPSGLEFTSGYADRAGSRVSTAAAAEGSVTAAEPEQPAPETKQSRAGRADVAQQLLATVRKPKVAIAVAGVLAVVIVLSLISAGGKEDGKGRAEVVTAAAAAPSSAGPAPSENLAAGSAIEVQSAESQCPAGGTPGMDAFSGQADKAWSCPRAYRVDGQILTIDLGKIHRIDSIGIVPGWDSIGADGADQWTKFRTVSRVSYRFNDPGITTYTQQTMDQRSLVVTEMSPPVTASKITLTVLDSSGDATVNTTAISSIVVNGQ